MKQFWILLCVLMVACFMIPGCGGGSTADIGSRAALMSDADIVFSVDEKAIMGTEIGKFLNKESGAAKSSFASMLNLDKETVDTIKKTLGVTEEDFVGFTFSAKLEGIKIDSLGTDPAGLPLVVGIEFAKDLTNKTLVDTAKILLEKQGGTVSEKDGLVVLEPPADQTDGPQKIFLCASGKTILIALNKENIDAALARGKAGEAEFPKALNSLKKSVSTQESTPQAFGIIKLPGSLQDELKAFSTEGSPFGPMIEPFKSIQSIVGSAEAGKDMKLKLCLELGNSSNAGGAEVIIKQGLENLKKSMPPEIAGIISSIAPVVNVESDKLIISIDLTEEKIMKLQEAAPMLQSLIPGGGAPGLPGGGTK